MKNRIQEVAKSKGWDWVLMRRAVFNHCLSNGIEPPTDSGMRLWWSGNGEPNGSNLLMIAKVLNVPAEELLGGETPKERKEL